MASSVKTPRALFFEPLSMPTAAQPAIMSTYEPKPKQVYLGGAPSTVNMNALSEGIPKYMIISPLLDQFLAFGRLTVLRNCGAIVRLQCGTRSYVRLDLCDAGASWRQMLVLQPHATPVVAAHNATGESVKERTFPGGTADGRAL